MDADVECATDRGKEYNADANKPHGLEDRAVFSSMMTVQYVGTTEVGHNQPRKFYRFKRQPPCQARQMMQLGVVTTSSKHRSP